MQTANYRGIRDRFGIAPQQEALLNFLVQRSCFLTYEAQASEYDVFAYLSLLLVARLSVGGNVPLQKVISFLEDDAGWSSVGDYIKRFMSNRSIEKAWIDFCKIELPDSFERLYDVYCRALDMVSERSRMGAANLPLDFISTICGAIIQDKDERILDIACGDGVIVSNIVRSGYLGNKVYGFELCPTQAVIAKTRIFLNGGDSSLINCCDGLVGSNSCNGRLYDVIITNPPAGNRYKVSYAQDSKLFPKFEFQDIKYYDTAYVIRSLELLKIGGRLAVFLPERTLCDKERLGFRQKIMRYADILAVVTFSSNALSNNCMAYRKCLLVLRRKEPEENVGNAKTCFGIVACSDESNCQVNLGLRDFVRFLKSDVDVHESGSAFKRRIQNNGIWLPRALIADEKFRFVYNNHSNVSIGDHLNKVYCPRTYELDKSLYFLSHDIDGIRRSTDTFRVKIGGRFIQHYNVAEAKNLLVTFKSGALLANVIPPDCDGLVIDRYSQMFAPLGYVAGRVPNWQVPLIVELLFLSDRYRQYLKNRFVTSVWKDDIVNFLLPPFSFSHKWGLLIETFKELKECKACLVRELSACQSHVSEMYMREVMLAGSDKRKIGITGGWPLIKLGDVVHRSEGSFGNAEGVLRGLEIDTKVVDKIYLSAVLMANAKRLNIEDEIWRRTSRGYSQYLIDKIVLPLPEIQAQRKFAFRVENSIAKFNALLKELCVVREDKTVPRLVDQELGYAD